MSENSEGSGEKPCQAPEHSQFDFWLGNWQVTWGEGEQGTNRIGKILGGCVVQEQFDGRPGTELQGMSLSTYNEKTGRWLQTWVDNSGGYLDFEGGWQQDKMILSRQVPGEQGEVRQRMVWFDIKDDSMLWNWERSEDGGDNWKLLWQLKYKRLQ
jgi:hypothetical protein